MLTRILLLAALIAGFALTGTAQPITNYSFTTSVGTFTNISGATSPTLTGSTDEGYFNAIPIGFDFWYLGVRYTTISASTNGWLTPGANITTATPANSLTSGGAPRPVIAPLWDNLNIGSAANVSYVTTGTPGTRIFTIEFLNVKWTAPAVGNTISFQAKLYESTGRIQFVYRPEAGAVSAPTASIGLSLSATGSTNFLSVSNAGTSASSTVEANITTRPVSGRTYSFTPPVPVVPGSLTFPSVSTTGMTINWTDLSSNEKGFVVYRSLDGITFIFDGQSAANSTSYVATGLSAGTLYYWQVYAVSEGALSTSALTGSQTTVCAGSPTVSATLTETCVGGSTGTISALATGGVPPYTFSLNGGAYQTSPNFTGLAAGIYTLNALGTSGCVSSVSVTIVPFATSTDDQNATALDSWVGHVYDDISFNRYIGQTTELENFNEFFGGNTTCFNVVSNGVTRSIFTEAFSVKFKMTSTRKGLYVVDLGGDDGNRLTVDGALVYNNFGYQSFSTKPAVLISLNGASSLLFEYFEASGLNQVMFQNLTQVFSNTLSTNTTQAVCIGNAALPVSGNTFASLPIGVTLSGTGYRWSYSTTATGLRTTIAGATAANFTPSTAAAPFNVAGTYFLYRNAELSSVNNVSPNPYIASNESNAAVVIVSGGGQWTGSVSTDWSNANNWCTGIVPTSTTDVVITSAAVRMPSIISAAACRNLTINSGATLTISAAGTLNIAGNFTNNGTVINNGTTNFNGTSGQQTFSGLTSFYNLTISNAGGLLLPGPITVNNNVLIALGVLNPNNFNIAVKGNWTNSASVTAFNSTGTTVTFNGSTPQAIGGAFATTFNNLVIANSASVVSLTSTISVLGDLAVNAGIFDLGAFTANRFTPGGILSVANSATLRIGGTNTYPSNYSTSTLVVASTVEYAGTNQTISNQLYGNLLLSSATGSVIKTFPATPMTIVGNLTSIIGTGTAVSFAAASSIAVSGNVVMGVSTTFSGGTFLHTVGGAWTNAGTFNGNTSTVTFTGPGTTVSGSGTQNFNHVTITAPGVVFSNGIISLSGDLRTTGSGSLSQLPGGTLLMSGSGAVISGSAISLDNLSISGSVLTTASFNINGDLSVSGSLTASAGTISMNGGPKTITGPGPINFSSLVVEGVISTAADFSIASVLSVNGSLSASGGTATFTGASTLSGVADLFNVTINGTSLQLSSNATMGIANVLTLTSGTLNVSSSIPNAVNFNGSGAQSINNINYYNLTLSGGNNKTAAGAITINNNITIASGTTFIPGAFTHSVYDDWINNGTFIAGTSTIQFLGTATTNILGTTTFNVLTINGATSDVQIILGGTTTAAIVHMTNGTLFTGANTLVITNTRTGSGNIYGTIRRTHAYNTGVVYAFKNDFNTITLSAESGVTSITVFVADDNVIDFPFGGSVDTYYDITVPSGTYTATLRLSYEDDELNGNAEATMGLWHYNGASWVAVGKTGNSVTSNYVELGGLTNITNRWTLSDNANAVRWNGSVSTDWNTAANWTTVQGSPTTPPSGSDIVSLGTGAFTFQPTISTSVTTNNIIFGSAQAVVLTLAGGGSLTTNGNISGSWSSTVTHLIDVGNQALIVDGDVSLSDGTAGRSIDLSVGAGSAIITGSLIQSGGANIGFTGAGTLNIFKDFLYVSGTFTAGSGTVSYDGDQNQSVANVAYYNLAFNKASGIASIDNPATVAGNLTVTAGELDNYATTVIAGNVMIAPGATLKNNYILHVGGNWTNTGTFIATGLNTIFDGAGTQTISSSTFNNFTVNKPVGTSAELAGSIVLNGDLTILSGTFNIKTFDCNRSVAGGTLTLASLATFIVGANNSPLNFSNGTLDIASTVIADGVNPQYIFGVDFGILIFRNAGVKILVAPITVNGDLIIESGATFDGGAETLIINGNWINNGTYIPSTATTIQGGTGKTISGNTTFNIVTITGTYVNLTNITYNGLLHITSTGSISSSTGIFTTLNGDLINNGVLYTLGTTTFTGNVLQTLSLINAVTTVALIVNFNGSVSPVLNSTSPPQYGYLNINNTGGVNPSVDWTILYSLAVASGASFNGGVTTQNVYGSVNNNGVITSSGTFNFIPATPATVNLGTGFTSTGLVNFGGAGALTLGGTPISFYDVLISNINGAGVSPVSNWNIGHTLTINSGAILNAGSFGYSIGKNISNHGTLNAGGSTFTLNGSGAQDIFSASPFTNVTMNNPTGIVTLSSPFSINGLLDFIAGKIQTNSYSVIQSAAGSVTGAAQATGWVFGKLQKNVGTGSPVRIFEVGDAVSYTPVTVAFAAVTSPGDLIVSSTPNDHPGIASSTVNPSKSVNRFWTLTNSGITFSTYDATLEFVAADIDGGAISASFGVALYDGFSWTLPVIASPNPTNIRATAVTSTGDFIVGEICNAGTTIAYTTSPYCSSGGTAVVTRTGIAGGIYSAPAGLTINATTGDITLATSTAGVYSVVYTLAAAGSCSQQLITTTVNITDAPVASIAYPGSPYAISNSTAAVTFSGTPGGTFSSTAGLSLDPVTGVVTLNTSSGGTYTVTYTVLALGGCGLYTTTAFITLFNNMKTWDGGAVTINWGDANNWNPNGVPTALEDINLNGASTITISVPAVVHNITLNNAALSVVINSGSTLAIAGNLTLNAGSLTESGSGEVNITVAGDWISNGGAFIPNSNTVGFNGTSIQNISGSSATNFSNMLITNTANPGVRIESNQNLLGVLTLTGVVFFDADGSNNTAVFKMISTGDNPTQDASIGILPAGSQINGNITVQRFMTKEGPGNNRIYRYISSPVQNAPVNDIQNEIPVTGSFTGSSICTGCGVTQSMFYYNETTTIDADASGFADLNDGYEDFPGTANAEMLRPGTGYALFVRGNILASTLWDVRGSVNAGNISAVELPVTFTSSTVNANDGWNLVGNPFPSTIDWDAASGWTKNNMENSIYIRDNGSVIQQFATWNGVTGTNGGTGNIASGQGFWTKANGVGTPSLLADENVKVPGLSTEFFREKELEDLLRITMTQGNVSDEAVIHFREDATPEFDSNADAWKLNNGSYNVYSLSSNNDRLAINSWSPLLCGATITLVVDQAVAGDYELVFTNQDSFQPDVEIWLLDTYQNDSIRLTSDVHYGFTINASEGSKERGRFHLKFSKTMAPVVIREEEGVFVISEAKGIQWYFNNIAIDGATLSSLIPTESGTYSVTVSSHGCERSGSVVFLVTGVEDPISDTRLYPNPTDGVFYITTRRLTTAIWVTNTLGVKLSAIEMSKTNDGYEGTLDIRNYPSGLYFVRIVSEGRTNNLKLIKK